MESEFQSYLVGICKCGNELWNNRDWMQPKWDYFNPECECEVEDPELEEMDEIISRINKTTQAINEMPNFNFVERLIL